MVRRDEKEGKSRLYSDKDNILFSDVVDEWFELSECSSNIPMSDDA
jgi:hypothetical protein